MPLTPVYGLPYEAPGDQPLHSLTGGSSGTEPILAEQVEAQLQRIDDDIAELVGVTIPDLQLAASRVTVLDVIDAGNGTNTTEFVNIPQTYRDLIIHWRGASDGSGELDSLALRFNGDSGNNYVSRLSRNEAAGTYTSSVGTFSVLRVGHVGTDATSRSAGTIWIPGYTTSGRKIAHGISNANGRSGGTNSAYTTQAGGYWTGTAPISIIRIWVSGQLWAGDPHITLIGVR